MHLKPQPTIRIKWWFTSEHDTSSVWFPNYFSHFKNDVVQGTDEGKLAGNIYCGVH